MSDIQKSERVLVDRGWFARTDLNWSDIHGILHDLADAGMLAEETEPGRWWRAVEPDGTVWAESSNEQEIRERMLSHHRLFRQHRTVPQVYWVEEEV